MHALPVGVKYLNLLGNCQGWRNQCGHHLDENKAADNFDKKDTKKPKTKQSDCENLNQQFKLTEHSKPLSLRLI